MSTSLSIIFYDGECGACNKFVTWVLQHDKSNSIHFCSLQTKYARTALITYKEFEGFNSLNTLYFLDKNKIYKRSKALIQILKKMQICSMFIILLKALPNNVLDLGYNIFAQNRYIFGTKQCKILSKEEKQRFL
jgi:predicted DCC family thiol-disulfide oxidoreductase YuxK